MWVGQYSIALCWFRAVIERLGMFMYLIIMALTYFLNSRKMNSCFMWSIQNMFTVSGSNNITISAINAEKKVHKF